jgi:tetratricopeptide (TPR) repeat protein
VIRNAVDLFLLKATNPALYTRTVGPWEDLVKTPTRRTAKVLMGTDSDLVLSVLQQLDASHKGAFNRKVRMCLGMVLRERGDYSGAIKAFNSVIAHDSQAFEALYNLALCQIALNEMEKAKSSLDSVLDLRPDDERALEAIKKHFPDVYQSIRPVTDEDGTRAPAQL